MEEISIFIQMIHRKSECKSSSCDQYYYDIDESAAAMVGHKKN